MIKRFLVLILWALFCASLAHAGLIGSRRALLSGGVPSFVPNPGIAPNVYANFSTGQGWNGKVVTPQSLISVTRASSGSTDLLPTSASGASYNIFVANTPRITSGLGLLVEESRTNFLLNSNLPVSQTNISLGVGTYTLWVNGAGHATMAAGSSGPATGCGTGTATNGNPLTVTITVSGTCNVGVTAPLNEFQLENGTFGTSFIYTSGSSVTRAADVVTEASPPTFGTSYSLYSSGTPYAPATYATAQVIFEGAAGTSNLNRLQLVRAATTGVFSAFSESGGTSTNFNPGTTWTTAAFGKIAASATAGAQIAVADGGTPATGAGSLPVGINAVYLGQAESNLGAFSWNGYLTEFAVWPNNALSAGQLQQITTLPPPPPTCNGTIDLSTGCAQAMLRGL